MSEVGFFFGLLLLLVRCLFVFFLNSEDGDLFLQQLWGKGICEYF